MTERSADTRAPRPPLPPPPAEPPSDDTAVRPSLADRIQARLSSTSQPSANGDARGTAPRQKPAKKPAAKPAAQSRGPRRARLRLTRVDPWSVMKSAFLLAIAFGVVTVVAVAMVWTVLDQAGVWSSINDTVKESIGGPETADFDIENYLGTSRVLGFTMLVAAVDVILLTAVATLGAFLYNMSAALLGGIEVTLAEDSH
jgi:hypothetical protein